MKYITYGRTGLKVSRTSFGCIPIQRISYDESTALLRRAYEGGINLYDTANGYTTSEDRIGTALSHVRDKIVICTKSGASNPEGLLAHLDNSLQKLRTDYIDIFQFHNPGFMPRPGGEDGLYDALAKAKAAGKVRFIGISYHRYNLAYEAVESGLYDSLQFPFSYLSTNEELKLVDHCKAHNVGILGMKGLCGGILTNAKAAFAYLRQYENIVPIWGIERMRDLEEFLSYEADPPSLDDALMKAIEADRAELKGTFCRACGYCLPCPAQIPIPMAARMSFLMGRTYREPFLAENWQKNMRNIDNCTACGHCTANCPYELNVPELLKSQQALYFDEIN
ncbi:MAG: aldo/keto reductase [Defluviitaleaceae bacterium]|nr:aldo/keto reductase [Defluviitaleaceae bacterium]